MLLMTVPRFNYYKYHFIVHYQKEKKKYLHTQRKKTKMIQLEEENEDRKLLTSDEEQKLVEEVLSDLPPEEKGEREEWNEQVGWHRKENIRKRGGTTRILDDKGGENDRIQQKQDITGNEDISRRTQKMQPHQSESRPHAADDGLQQATPSPSVLLILIALVFVGFIMSKLFRSKSHNKGRTL